MDSQSQANCAEWCKSHYWQLQEKRGWRYQFRESTMVRYYEEANLDPTLLEPLVEFLKGDGWQACCTVHNKPIDATGWKTRDVWYETRDGDVKADNKLKRTRIYHAFYKENGEAGGDGPWTVENGCKWKVSHTFYWRVASLPPVPQGESGVQYRMQGVTRDDETGLWSCVIEKRETVRQDIPEYGTAQTVFEHRTEEQHLGVRQGDVARTGKAASAGGGKMVRRQLRKNEDCTTDVINETVEERPVAGAVEETTKTARGTRTTVVNRNQANKAGLGSAMSVRNEKTDGGLWNQTITTFARFVGWIRATCRKTIYMHEHAETVTTNEDPGFDHVASAGGGVIMEKTATRNDENGYDVETRTREEQNVPGAIVETQKFVDGVTVTTVNRGQPAAASASGLKIGERVRNEKTEGGLVDQTITQASVEAVGRTGEACEQDALVHTHSETQGVGTQAQEAEVTAPGAGQIRMRRTRLTERGAWEVTDETRTAKPAEAEAEGGTTKRHLTVKSLRNQSAITPPAPSVNEEVDVTVQKNEFGLNDGTVRRTVHDEQTETARSGNMLVDEERTQKLNTEEGADFTPEKGTVYDASAQPNGMGAKNITVVKRTAKPAVQTVTWDDCDETLTRIVTYRNTLIVFRNQDQVPEFPAAGSVNPSVSINEFGLLDGVIRIRRFLSDVAKTSGGEGSTGEKTRVIKRYKEAIVNKDGKPTGAKRTVVASETTYWSTDPMVAIRHFVNSEGGHGFKPRLFARGPYYMAITYKNIDADDGWVLGDAIK